MKFLSLGAGVQSTTIFRMMCLGELAKADHAIFADTQWEPVEVYNHLDKLKEEGKKAGIPVHVVTYGDIRRDSLEGYVYNDRSRIGRAFATMPLYSTGYIPGKDGMLQRQCTNRYKIQPVEKKMKQLLGIETFRKAAPGSVEQVFGISADESRRVRTSGIKAIKYLYPFIFENSTSDSPLIWRRPGFTREDCLTWNLKKGFTAPPRSACVGCPYHSNAEWRRIKADPKQWADAVEFDKAIRKHPIRGECFLHRDNKPLDQVDLDEKDPDQMEIECQGMCGI